MDYALSEYLLGHGINAVSETLQASSSSSSSSMADNGGHIGHSETRQLETDREKRSRIKGLLICYSHREVKITMRTALCQGQPLIKWSQASPLKRRISRDISLRHLQEQVLKNNRIIIMNSRKRSFGCDVRVDVGWIFIIRATEEGSEKEAFCVGG